MPYVHLTTTEAYPSTLCGGTGPTMLVDGGVIRETANLDTTCAACRAAYQLDPLAYIDDEINLAIDRYERSLNDCF